MIDVKIENIYVLHRYKTMNDMLSSEPCRGISWCQLLMFHPLRVSPVYAMLQRCRTPQVRIHQQVNYACFPDQLMFL